MPPASLLIKPVSGRCNLACSYCFYRDVASHRDRPDFGRMSLETAEHLIRGAFADAEGFCSFAFQGGEPTLAGLPFYRDFVRLVRKYNTGNIEVRLLIQTNGLLIDREWAEFLRDEDFLVGLSIDGPRMLHDLYRRSADGSGSFTRVMEGARTLKEVGTKFNILCVIDGATADNPLAVHDFFRSRGFAWIQYIPCIEDFDASPEKPSWTLTPAAWATFQKAIFDAWYREIRSGNGTSVRYFDNLVDMAMGYPPESCGMAGRCTAYFTVEADGSVFPCDFYVLDQWRMGNVKVDGFKAMMDSETARRFVKSSEHVSPECRDCFAYPLCRGGCRRDREPFADGLPGVNRFCEGQKDFFAYAGQRIMDLAAELRRGEVEARGHSG
ncbi:MAG: anaerobic sulfatase maturase [Spirochaetota bacterium]